MKRFSIFALLATLLMGACSENFTEQDALQPETTTLPDLTAGFADDATKTYVENGKYLRWHEEDLISAFYGNTLNRQYKFKGKTGDNSGTFSLVPSGELGTGNDLEIIYALYPYNANATITDEGVISLTLPATQLYAENSFGKNSNTMIAVTESVEDTFLPFKNACGYLKLSLWSDNATLASIEVRGNNGEKIAGAATATMAFGGVPELVMSDDATTSVKLNCGLGVKLGTSPDTATELWIVLPETTFKSGITITATNTNGSVFEKSTPNEVIITRNDVQPMAELKAVFPAPKPANDEIWFSVENDGDGSELSFDYDAILGIDGYPLIFKGITRTTMFDKDHNNIWAIKFDGTITTIGESAFQQCSTIYRIGIPDSVTKIGAHAFSYCDNLYGSLNEGYLKLPDGVIEIGDNAFEVCRRLSSVSFGSGVTQIGFAAFRGCGISGVGIPDNVKIIGSNAFAYNPLYGATIGSGVESIGSDAFMGSVEMYNLTCNALTPPSISGNILRPASGFAIRVPAESVASYRSAWSSYAQYIVAQ